MKYIITSLLLLFLLANSSMAQSNASLSKYKVVPLNKKTPDGTKVLAGIANIRFKQNAKMLQYLRAKHAQLLSIYQPDFTVIESYLPNARKVSRQAARFSSYTKLQQQAILFHEEKLERSFIVQFPEAIDVTTFCRSMINKYSDVEIAEPYYISKLQYEPKDTYIEQQRDLFSQIKAFEAWDICQGSADVLIGIGDSGFNIAHKDLGDSAIAYNYSESQGNMKDDDNNGYVDDYLGYNFAWYEDGGADLYDNLYNQSNSHGMQVAGIVGARTDNNFGIAGVGNKCKIVPMKVCEKNDVNVLYGYQSIIYATVRGCKVLNCSWGAPSPFSFVNQSIVDYALACGMSIVAASGNAGNTWIDNMYSVCYPAGYYGVLGAGSVDKNDVFNTGYVRGTALRIVAPDQGLYTLAGTETVERLTSRGTSFATPVVAGTVGIVRAYLPNITAIEAIEIVRKSADNIRNKAGNNNNGFAPNRVNMLNALRFDYQNIPSIILKEHYYENTEGIKQEQFFANDTATLVLNVVNILGNASNVKLSASLLYCPDQAAITMLEDTNNLGIIEKINKNEEHKIKIKFIVNKPRNVRNIMYLLKMEGLDNNSNPFIDDFKFRILLSENITTLKNDSLIVAVSDMGTIGYDLVTEYLQDGTGFEHIKLGDYLYEAGFLATTNLQKAVSTNLDTDVYLRNDFDAVYGAFEPNNTYTNTITDTRLPANLRLGLEVTTKYSFPSSTEPVLKMNITAKNVSSDFFEKFSMGHFYDWDIINNSLNIVSYFAEGIPSFLSPQTAAAEIAKDLHNNCYIGSLVFINTDKFPNVPVVPQANGSTGYNYLNKQNQINALSDGIAGQTNFITDINYIVGLQFTNGLSSNSSAECVICTGISETKEGLAKALEECAKSEISSIKDNKQTENYQIVKDGDYLIVKVAENLSAWNSSISLYNLLGEKLLTSTIANLNTIIDLASYPNGAYFIRIHSNNQNSTKSHTEVIIK